MADNADLQVADEDLQTFLERIPTPKVIRARMSRNADETVVLKRLLKLSLDAERARCAEQDGADHE